MRWERTRTRYLPQASDDAPAGRAGALRERVRVAALCDRVRVAATSSTQCRATISAPRGLPEYSTNSKVMPHARTPLFALALHFETRDMPLPTTLAPRSCRRADKPYDASA
jgi:hypothetical protein